jgi:hypothetical protein
MAIRTKTPSQIIAGDTAEWLLSFQDYPASSWALSFVLVKPEVNNISFSALTSGDDYIVTVPKAITSAWVAGKYAYQAAVTSATQRFVAETGFIEVFADFAQATAGFDARSNNKIMVDLTIAVLKARASNPVIEYTVANRHLRNKTDEELRAGLDYWEERLRAEEAAKKKRKSGKSQFITAQTWFV